MNIPTYEGRPLSVLTGSRPLSGSDNLVLWSWAATNQPLMSDLNTIDRLVSEGYEQIKALGTGFNYSQLHSQCCDVVHVQDRENINVWARAEDADRIRKNPVTLAFTLHGLAGVHTDSPTIPVDPPSNDSERLNYLLQFLPPPLTGEYGVIYTGDGKLTYYHISLLGDVAQQLWRQLTQALDTLAAPFNTWVSHSGWHAECASELNYLNRITDLRSRIIAAHGKDRQELGLALAMLEEGHRHVVALRQSWLKPDWLVQWTEIRRMAQDLAAMYSEHHKANINRESNQPIPEIAHAFNADGIAKMFSCLPMQAYSVAATAPLAAWNKYASEKENELIMGFPYQKPSGGYHILMKEDTTGQDREKVLARMEKSIENMGDYDSDLFMMMVLQLIVGRRNENGNVIMSAQKALEYHNTVAKKNPKDRYGVRTGGPRGEDLEKWSDSYLRMKNKWMKLDEVTILDDSSKPDRRGRRKRTKINREAPLFMFGEVITHETLPLDGGAGKKIVVAWEYREATWMLPFVKGSNVYTSGILQDCFMFDPYHETWEKRLSKHFFFWLRTNAKSKEPPPIRIRDLFSELHLETDSRNPARTRERFERAMNVLEGKAPRTTNKQVLRPHLRWTYTDTFKLPRKNWLETWLSQQITVMPPTENPNARILEAAQTRREQIQSQQIKAEAATIKKRGRPLGIKNKK